MGTHCTIADVRAKDRSIDGADSRHVADSPTNLFTLAGIELTLVAGLPCDELARRMALAARGGDVCHRALAFYVHDMEARRVHQELGYGSAAAFAHDRLDMSKGRARDLLLVGRKLHDLPRLDAAFARGQLSWSKVRRVARVAVAATEHAWITRCEHATHEEVDAMVACAREGDAPPSLDRGLPHARFVKRFVLDSVRHEMFERARDKLAAELRRTVTDDDVLDEMLRLLLASDADGSVPGRQRVDGSLFRVDLPDAGEGDASTPDAAVAAASDDATVPAPLRRRVLARDRHRCRTCASRRSLMLHHVVWHSRGGATTLANLVTLCARCHGLVHEDWLRVQADAHGAFHFTDHAGRPLRARHPDLGPSLRVTCAAAHRSESAPASKVLLTEDDIPDVVDGEWWRRHEHLLEWRGGRLRVRRGMSEGRGGGEVHDVEQPKRPRPKCAP